MVNDALALALAFLAGSTPFSWLIARHRYGIDLRAAGDGNVGAGNLLALAGAAPGVAAILLDILKGAAAVALALVLSERGGVAAAAGALAVLGHVFPPWLGFSGGRGAAPALGVALGLFPLPGLAMLVCGGIALALTRGRTVAGIAAAVVALVVAVPLAGGDWRLLLFVAALFVAVGLKDLADRRRARRAD